MPLSRLFQWLKRKPGKNILARWIVNPSEWCAFVAQENARPDGEPYSELPPTGDGQPGGVEIIVEPHAIWMGGKRVSIPLRGAPEVLCAGIEETAGSPTTIELSLKHPAYARPNGGLNPARYSRLAVPVPRSAWVEAKRVAAHFNRDTPGTPDFFHGRGDGSDPEDLSRCWSCGTETYKYRSECAACGASLQSRRWSRRAGGVLVACGLFLCVLMGAVLYHTVPMLLRPGQAVGGTTFNGSGAMAAVVLGIFLAVFTFGAGTLGYGAWQAATGKRSLRVAYALASLIGGVLALAALLASWSDR